MDEQAPYNVSLLVCILFVPDMRVVPLDYEHKPAPRIITNNVVKMWPFRE